MQLRLFVAAQMEEIATALAYSDPVLAAKVATDSEMVDGGYLASLTENELARLTAAGLPAGRAHPG